MKKSFYFPMPNTSRNRHGRPPGQATNIKPIEVDPSDRRIHEAVAELVQEAAEQNGTAAEFVYQHVQELIQGGWKREDAEQVGSRAIGVLNAMKLPTHLNLR